jgi:hypothetical protein
VTIGLPADMDRFLGESANRTPPPLFSRLLAGPATKGTDRIEIILKDGGVSTDIYGAVLVAIKNLVPPMEHLERAVNQEVQRITKSSVSGTRVNNAVRQINKIAYEHRGVSDPVLRVRDDKLFIQDAMLAFYLNHGAWTPSK